MGDQVCQGYESMSFPGILKKEVPAVLTGFLPAAQDKHFLFESLLFIHGRAIRVCYTFSIVQVYCDFIVMRA